MLYMKPNEHKPVRLAVIGAGARGTYAYAPYALRHPEDLAIVAAAEPDAFRRERFARMYGLADSACFTAADAMLDRSAALRPDAVLIASPDAAHVGHIRSALRAGIPILAEKPLASKLEELDEIEDLLERTGTPFMICHVLRHTAFFRTIKRLLDEGAVGRIMSIQHNENVGHFHMAHSFVRGNWRNTAESSPMILAKCCHDMDILNWLIDADCERVASFGSRAHFRADRAPEDAPERCLEGCPAERGCPYSARRYLEDQEHDPMIASFARTVRAAANDATLEDALRRGPYGRCVYRCDNDVVDHQVASLEYSNGATVSFAMTGFTQRCERTLKITGTDGEIRAAMERAEIEVSRFRATGTPGGTERIEIENAASGHGGGDEGLIRDFLDLVRGGGSVRDAMRRAEKRAWRQGISAHRMALAAEEARLKGTVIELAAFRSAAMADGRSGAAT